VVTQGNTEIELTGHFDDFENTTLIAKHVIDEVNAEIKVNSSITITHKYNSYIYKITGLFYVLIL
jgi:hypothetical protein